MAWLNHTAFCLWGICVTITQYPAETALIAAGSDQTAQGFGRACIWLSRCHTLPPFLKYQRQTASNSSAGQNAAVAQQELVQRCAMQQALQAVSTGRQLSWAAETEHVCTAAHPRSGPAGSQRCTDGQSEPVPRSLHHTDTTVGSSTRASLDPACSQDSWRSFSLPPALL